MLALALTALDDGKAADIVTLDVRDKTPLTDHMLICSGTSRRHVQALADNLVRSAKEVGHRPKGIEGSAEGEWILVDLGSVIIHVMQPQARAFYQLEKLWSLGVPQDDPD